MHARGVDAQLTGEAPAAVLGVDDHRVEAVVEAALGCPLARARLAREDVVRGQHERRAAAAERPAERERRGQQPAVEVLDRQPLEVHDVGRARRAAVAEHVGHVLERA